MLLLLGLAGCSRYVAVEPIELVRVAAPEPAPRARSVQNVDGELVEIDGEFDAIVRTTRGDHAFSRPVVAWFAPGMLVISGAGEPPVGFPIGDIRAIELKQFSAGRTAALVVPISAAALVLLLLSTGDVGH